MKTRIDSCAQSTLARERRPLSTSAENGTGDQEKRTSDRGSQEAAPHIVSLPRSGKKSRICGYGFRFAIWPRDARPNRSTPDLSRPCDLDAGFRGGRSRRCLLRAHRVLCDSVGVGGGRLERPRPYARTVVHTTSHHFLLDAQIYYSQPGIRPEVNITTNRVFTPLHTISH